MVFHYCVCVFVLLALIKRFMKDCFWGRLDYLIIGSYANNPFALIP